MPVFYISNQDIEGAIAYIQKKSDIKHISNVLRAKTGQEIDLISPNKEILKCEISKIFKDKIKLKIISKELSEKKLQLKLNLISSILKNNAQDFLIQKATELGVDEITPVLSRYSVPKFKNEQDKTKKIQKWQLIADESCKQCERATIPSVLQINELKNTVKEIDISNTIVCVERNATYSFKESIKNLNINDRINIIIGPEGGWSNEELALFNSLNIKQASLGNLILRAETAAIKAISNVIYEYENN